MSQAPEDATAQPSKKEEAKQALKGFGNKLKQMGQKAVDNTKKFVEETEEDIKNTKTMSGLITMAANEFQAYIKQKSQTTDKVSELKKIADSFKSSEGICFVASFNVAFTVGGSYGRGIVMKRLGDGNWSLPLAIQEIEGNVGWQLNVSRSKTFYVLKNDQAIKNFQQKQNVKLGGKGFAAIGNLGIQAQGNVKASQESLTKTTNDAKEVAATNASVGSVKGLAIGANVNLGTFQPCKKINDMTYDNFDINKLFEKGVNSMDAENEASDHYDAKNEEENVNKMKSDDIVPVVRHFVRALEGVIKMEKAEAEVEAAAKAMRAKMEANKNKNANSNDASAAK